MILVAGATGQLGSRVVRCLRRRDVAVRGLLRRQEEAGAFEELGVEVATGDLRDPESLARACEGVDAVICGVTVVTRLLSGEKTSFDAVDRRGTITLVDQAERAGASRFVYISAAGLDRAPSNPLVDAKRSVEAHLATSRMRSVIVRPDAFEEVWLSPVAQLDWDRSRLNVLGHGDTPQRYVSVDDVAELVATLALEPDPPGIVEFGGPEALTPNQVCDLIEELAGRPMKRRHVPRVVLAVLARALARPRPGTATILGLGLAADRHPATWDDGPLLARGIRGTTATAYLRDHVR